MRRSSDLLRTRPTEAICSSSARAWRARAGPALARWTWRPAPSALKVGRARAGPAPAIAGAPRRRARALVSIAARARGGVRRTSRPSAPNRKRAASAGRARREARAPPDPFRKLNTTLETTDVLAMAMDEAIELHRRGRGFLVLARADGGYDRGRAETSTRAAIGETAT
ncbi:MAG: hypothetical protein U0271_40785 [Polyangiaceae bacterium]